jgi:hypothetical protein
MMEIVCSAILIAISVLTLVAWSWWHFRSNYRDDVKSLYGKIDAMTKDFTKEVQNMQKDISGDFVLVRERIVAVERDIKWIKGAIEDKWKPSDRG